MTNFDDLFNKAASATNDDKVAEGGFNPLAEGNYQLTIAGVRADPFKNGSSFAIDYLTENGEQASETFSIETRDQNGAQKKMSALENNLTRLTAIIVATQMAGILAADDFKKGDEHVAEALQPLGGLQFWSKVSQYEYENNKGEKRINNRFTHSFEEIKD